MSAQLRSVWFWLSALALAILALIGVVMLIAFGWFGYSVLSQVDGVAMKEAPPTMVDMLPPPPPPPWRREASTPACPC